MILGHGVYTLGLSEREMSMILDALDGAVEQHQEMDTVFTRRQFDDLRSRFSDRFKF